MSRSANVATADTQENKTVTKIMVDMPLSLAAALEAYSTSNNVTKVSVARKFVADGLGFTGEGIELVSRSDAGKAAGAKRKVKNEAVRKSATLLETLKAKLVAGGDLDLEDIKAMILQS